MFAKFVSENYKGSGDYGVVGFGVYNGQTANRPELNNNLHMVARVSVPIQIGSQIIEPGIQAHAGRYVVPVDNRTPGVKTESKAFEFNDRRVAATFVLYPKPFGILAEYNYGQGPRYDPSRDSISNSKLNGGYATLYYRYHAKKDMYFFPYTRIQTYDGGKKFEQDARSYVVREIETGVEWQVNRFLELTAAYVISNREFEDSRLRDNDQKGNLLRLQLQLNF
jgi:hypothetical protein